MTRKPDIHFHIEELILDGFPERDRRRIAEATQRELERLFIERQTPAGLANDNTMARLNAGSFRTTSASRPESTGNQVALAVFRSLSK